MCLSTAVVLALVGTSLFKSPLVTGSSNCWDHKLPCENGGCVAFNKWCDSRKDCSDGSDERYCKKSGLFSGNPNKCPSSYYKCDNGPCIPMVGLCDGFKSCSDSSDEKNCAQPESSTKNPNKCPSTHFRCLDGPCIPIIGLCDGYEHCEDSSDEKYCHSRTPPSQDPTPVLVESYQTTLATDLSPTTEIEGSTAVRFFASLNVSQNSVQVMQFSGLHFSDFSDQRNKARNWILSQRKSDYGWGDETHRAIAALYLSDVQPRNTTIDVLMIKQLEIQLSIELARNVTKPLKLTDLALYINALLLSCKNPKNFYGDNLVSTLRDEVNNVQKKGTFINPSIYLTLCLNNATTGDDIKEVLDIFLNWNITVTHSRIDMQALTLLTTACIFRKTNSLNASMHDMYDSIKMKFLRSLKFHGFPGNVYEAALIFQALQEMKITIRGLTDFILKQQLVDGSFGDILSTYLVLPILAGRNIVQTIDYCGQQITPDLIPLEVLKNVKSRKMHVQYSLNYGFPPELTQTLQMHVANATNVLDVMRLAQEINPKYQFKLSENREVPVVYSIGEKSNDVEKGMYWTIYIASKNSSVTTNDVDLVPYIGDIKKLILEDGDKVLFWYRPIESSS